MHRGGGVRAVAKLIEDYWRVIRYCRSTEGVTPQNLTGFFVGWPAAPSPGQHLAALRGSHRVVLAWDDDRIVGFVNAISDGVLTAFVPWLEVLPSHQGQGIGSTLVRTMMESLTELYSVDLVCDEQLRGFYTRLGLQPLLGMGHRNRNALTAAPGQERRPNRRSAV